jgi:hypothetical protein
VTTPSVSICIPTFNGARYLAQTLDSICAQTFGEFEVLIVDDGSSDATLDLCAEFARRDRRIRIERNPRNLGLVGNWNRCVALARAPWVKFVFQDDLLRPQGLQALMDVAAAGEAPLAFGRRTFLFEGETAADTVALYEASAQRVAALFPDRGHSDARAFSKLLLAHLTWNIVGEPVAVLLRRDVFEAVGPFHPDVAVFCDMEFWARVGTRFGVAHTPETVADFRVHGGSTTARTLSGDHFRLHALDHVVVQHQYGFDPAYAALREVAAAEGLDLVERFTATALWARGLAERLASEAGGGDRRPLTALEQAQARLPRLRQVLQRARRRHELGQMVGRVKRAVLGRV